MLITCSGCGKRIDKRTADINKQRRLGQTSFYCSLACCAATQPRKRALIAKRACPVCGTTFECRANVKRSPTHCSRGCASAGSVTPYRRRIAQELGRRNLPHGVDITAAGLRSREAWRYAKVRRALLRKKVEHQFELPLGKFIYDLGLLRHKVVVEFDGGDHAFGRQRRLDAQRDRCAARLGWTVKRVAVAAGAVVPVGVLAGIV